MARYTDAVCRLCRRQGEKLFLKGERCFSPKCAIESRNAPPGQHGQARRRKMSEHGLQLKEKQRARVIFGVLERQFRRYYEAAKRRPGVTGENLLQELELRLDNVIFRMGLADSRNQARQIVLHGHIALNGRKTNIPSAQLKPGDSVTWNPKRTDSELYKIVKGSIESKSIPEWLTVDVSGLSGRVVAIPSRDQMEAKINEQAIVEFYSR